MPLTGTARRAAAGPAAAAAVDEAVEPGAASTATTTTTTTPTTVAAPITTPAFGLSTAGVLNERISGETDETASEEDSVLSVVIDACEAELNAMEVGDDALIDAETVEDSVTETKRYNLLRHF